MRFASPPPTDHRPPGRGPRLSPSLALLALLAAAAPRSALAVPASFPSSDLVQDRWTTRDGLPVSQVDALRASASGYLWLGTQEGVARFDGSRFTVFDRANEPGLPVSAGAVLHEDQSGALWAGSEEGLAVRRGQHFEPVRLGPGARVRVRGVADAPRGGVWVGTDQGLFRVAAGAREGERDGELADLAIAALVGDGAGGVWVAGPSGLAHLEANGAVRRLEGGAIGRGAERLAVGRDGRLWIGGSGVYGLDPDADRPALLPGSAGLWVKAFLVDRDGVLWVGAFTGLFRQVGGGLEPVRLAGGPLPILSLEEDADGSVWVGSTAGGLQRLRVGAAATVGVDRGLASDVVNAVLEGRDGTVWIASGAGLDTLRGGITSRVPLPLAAGERVFSLDEDAQGRVWVGTDRRIFQRAAGSWREFPPGSSIDAKRFRALMVDAEGVLWAGTLRGLYRLDGDRFVPALDAEGKPVTTVVAALARTPSGALWAGGAAGVGPIVGGRFRPVAGTGACYGLTVGAGGTVWAGQLGGGLVRIRGERVERFTRSEGILEVNVANAIEDGRGGLWLTGNHGVQRVLLAELDAVAEGRARAVAPLLYGVADGMGDRECNGSGNPSAWRGADGRLWFPTVKGAVAFDPAREEPLPPPPRVAIEEVLVDGDPVDPEGYLRLPAGTRRVTIRYTGLALSAPDRLRFRHRLSGFDEGEVDAGSERVVQYTGLPPGRYRFAVRALRERGVASERPAELTFILEPRPWQTPEFVVLAVLALLLALAWADRLRVRGARRREEELRRRVAAEMAKVKVLSGLLPVCPWCNRIQVEGDTWQRLDHYVEQRSAAQFNHVMCPTCAARMEREDREG